MQIHEITAVPCASDAPDTSAHKLVLLRRISLAVALGVCPTASPGSTSGIVRHVVNNNVIEYLVGDRKNVFAKRIRVMAYSPSRQAPFTNYFEWGQLVSLLVCLEQK